MAHHGYVEFGGRVAWVREGALAVLVEALLRWGFSRKGEPCGDWIREICERWLREFEESPPGLKAVELDELLAAEGRMACLVEAVREVKRESQSRGPEFLPDVCDRLLSVMGLGSV